MEEKIVQWGMPEYMTLEEAACVLKLYQDTKVNTLLREVYVDGVPITRRALAFYIRSSPKVDSEASLLKCLVDYRLPSHITFFDCQLPQLQPQLSGMYMHHTISRDLSGTNDQVTSKLLAALGERSSRKADLSILAERSTRKTDLSILSEISSRGADLSVLISKS